MKKLFLLSFMLVGTLGIAQVPTTNLAGEYRFTNGSIDDTAGSDHLTQSGSNLTLLANRSAGANRAVSLNGDYLQRSNNTAFALSASYWVKTTTNDANKRVIIDQTERTFDAEASDKTGWYTYLENGKIGVGGNFQWYHSNNTAAGATGYVGYQHLVSSASVDDGNWHNVIITMHARWYNWLNGPYNRYERIIECTYTLYVDGSYQGVLAQQKNVGSAPSPAMRRFTNGTISGITVGNIGNGTSTSQYQDGFDDFRYYTKLLNGSEIAQLASEAGCSGSTSVTAVAQDVTIQLDANGDATLTAEEVDNGSTDSCGDPATSLILDVSSFTCADLGANTVTLTALDYEGNSNTATATVTVESFIDVVTPNTAVVLEVDENGDLTLTPEDVNAGTVSSCGNLTYSLDRTAFSCSDVGSNIVVTLTATDSEGTTDSSPVTVRAEDSTDPVIVTQDIDVTLDAATGLATITTAMVDDGSSDNCNLYLSLSKTQFSCTDIGENTVTLTGQDNRANVGTATAVVTVHSIVADETVTSADQDLCPDGSSGATISIGSSVVGVDYYLRNSSNDDVVVGPVAGTGSAMDFNTGMVATTTTFHVYGVSATDASGNPACGRQMSTEITVGDNEAPTVLVSDISVEQDASGTTTISAADLDNGSTDNCTSSQNLTWSLDQSSFACGALGDNTVTVTVTDESGNSASAQATVTITSAIFDQTVSTETSHLCPGVSATISMADSQTGVTYYLRNEAEEVIGDPVQGTGEAIDFETGELAVETTFHVHAQLDGPDDVALQLAGANGYVNIPNSPSLQLNSNWTLEAWVNPSSTNLNVIETYNSNGGYILRAINGRWVAYAMQTSGVFATVTSQSVITQGVWTHVAATFDESTNQLKMYVDGVLETTNTNVTLDQRGSTTTIKLGARGDDNYLQGQLTQDNVAIWNVALSASDILARQTSSLSGSETGLVAYYDFNGLTFSASGMTIPDLSSNSNDGTLMGNYAEDDFVEGASSASQSGCGKQMSLTHTITVGDDEAPVAIAKDITVSLGEGNTVQVTAAMVDNGSYDGCGNVTLEIARNGTLSRTKEETVSGVTFYASDLGENEVTLTVYDGNGNSASVVATVTVDDNKSSQTITFPAFTDVTYGVGPQTLSATASSSLTVSYQVLSGPGAIQEGALVVLGAGDIVVSASQGGNEDYTAATAVEQTLTVNKADLVVTADNKTMTYGETIPALSISYSGFVGNDDESDLAEAPIVSHGVILGLGSIPAGTYPIEVSGGASSDYNLTLHNGTLTVNKLQQILEIAPIENKQLDAAPFDLVATVNSDRTIVFTVSGPATLNGTTITIDGTIGEVTITASVEGDDNHEAATVSVSFMVTEILSVDDLVSRINIYPNPTHSMLNINSPVSGNAMLYNIEGQLVDSLELNGSLHSTSVSHLESGMYVLLILNTNSDLISRSKVVINH